MNKLKKILIVILIFLFLFHKKDLNSNINIEETKNLVYEKRDGTLISNIKIK